jgi:hypothetical protein
VRELAVVYNDALRRARTEQTLALQPLRRALGPVVARMAEDPDAVIWLLVTEPGNGFLPRRALESAVLMALVGQRIGFSSALVAELALGGLLLDIGKVTVPVGILAKTSPLSTQERAFCERHVRRGLRLVHEAVAVSDPVADAVLGHHERLDGSGYPRRLRGTELPLAARLAGLVDTYDALLHDRRYARACSPHDAIRIVHGLRRRKFDAALVDAFTLVLGLFPVGCWVQIADGRLGLVRRQRPEDPTRPVVALVCDSAGRRLPGGGMLWTPLHAGDIVRAVEPAGLHVDQSLVASALDSPAIRAA